MKKLKITTIILAILLVTLVAFGGVYVKTQNRMEDKVKDYSLGRELYGERMVVLKVLNNEEHKQNPEDLKLENYEIVKETIRKRLDSLGTTDYTISLNEADGTIKVELPENNSTDSEVYYLIADSKVKINERDTKNELLSDDMVKKATYGYKGDAEGKYQVTLEIELTKEGKTKIEEIKNNFAVLSTDISPIEEKEQQIKTIEEEIKKLEDEKKEVPQEKRDSLEKNKSEVSNSKKIAKLTLAGQEYEISNIDDGKIIVNVGGNTSNQMSVNNNLSAAAEISMLVNAGKYPLEYEVTNNQFLYSDITDKNIIYLQIVVLLIILISFIVLIYKYKTNGLLSSISFIGFVSIYLLLIRYTNVVVSIESIGIILMILALNYIINYNYLNKEKNVKIGKLAIDFIPLVVLTITFAFSKWENLNSCGMTMFWGIILIFAYNYFATRTLLKINENN